MNKTMINWILGILIAVLAFATVDAFRVSRQTDATNVEYATRIDELTEARHLDSVAYRLNLESLKAEYESRLQEKDSVYRVATQSTSTHKTVIRTVYKDSIREVYTENTESVAYYEEKIATLRDSLGKALAQKDGVEVQYVEKIIRDTIFVYKTAKDSSAATKTEIVKPAQGKLGVFVDGHASYGKDGFGYEATGGVKYHILEPLYLKAGVQYDGDLRGILGGGIEFRF